MSGNLAGQASGREADGSSLTGDSPKYAQDDPDQRSALRHTLGGNRGHLRTGKPDVDDEPYTEDLDLASVTTYEELAALLRTVHLRADRPSLRTLEARTRHDVTPLSKTAVSEMLKAVRFPRKAVMVNFLRACGVGDDHMAPWSRAWERLAVREPGPAQPKARYTVATRQARVAASRDQHPDWSRRGIAAGENAKNGGAERLAGPSSDAVDPQTERLRDEINRLRLQLAAIDKQRAEQGPHFTDAASVRAVHSPIASRRELGVLLRKHREEQGLTVKQVADLLMCSTNKVRGMEANFRAGTLRDVRDLCEFYSVTPKAERDRMMKLAEEGKQQGWWQSYELGYATYVGLEAEAVAVAAFQSSVVHGLLQTAEYARAGHEGAMPRISPDRIEMQIEAKLTRQLILRRDNPPRFAAVLDEAALHRMVGGRQVMAEQMAKILQMSALPNVVVQVLPYELGAHPAMESNFTILELPNPTPGIVFVEGLIGSTYLERPDDLKRYREIFNQLQSIALSPKDTADLIANLSRSYRDD
jgi:transcriptional regulator with XRE-family HTH domain